MSVSFGSRRIYYNNFAAHLLNAYNPNMLHPALPYRWSDDDWRACIDMIADFGYTTFQFWLVPRLFCREGLDSDMGRECARQLNIVCEYAHTRDIQIDALCGLATVGARWHTYCPNLPAEWAEIRHLWEQWLRRLPGLDSISIFPGDPGACSRHGCDASIFIDRSCDIAALARQLLPQAGVTLHTWGNPFFGWGNIQGPPGWSGEFIQSYQHTAWSFDKARADAAMQHLLRRLPDFPADTAVAINLGFNPDGNPDGDQDARPWAREIARTHRIETWDFSLTEGENNVVPHYRVERLFAQRRRERESAPYSGGICYTMSPMLNQLSLYLAAHSFRDPDADPHQLAGDFYARLFGPEGRKIVPYLPLFEAVKDWGNYLDIEPADPSYYGRMIELRNLLASLESSVNHEVPLLPSPEAYRQELQFFADLFANLSAPTPDFDALARRYWQRVYRIYDHLGEHVDPRPRQAVKNLIKAFRAPHDTGGPIAGKWSD